MRRYEKARKVQSVLYKIYCGSPGNISTSYRESISYGFVYTISNIYMFIYIHIYILLIVYTKP